MEKAPGGATTVVEVIQATKPAVNSPTSLARTICASHDKLEIVKTCASESKAKAGSQRRPQPGTAEQKPSVDPRHAAAQVLKSSPTTNNERVLQKVAALAAKNAGTANVMPLDAILPAMTFPLGRVTITRLPGPLNATDPLGLEKELQVKRVSDDGRRLSGEKERREDRRPSEPGSRGRDGRRRSVDANDGRSGGSRVRQDDEVRSFFLRFLEQTL
jgi:hypothetical protein